MVSYEPTVAANIRKHERDIRKLGSAPLGPVSLGPGDHIRPEGSAAFRFDQSGAYLSHRGVLTNLSDLTDDFASAIDGHGARLSAAEGTLVSHDTRITKAQSDVGGVYSTVQGHSTRLSAAEGTLASHSGSLAGMHETLGLHGGRLGTAESRLNGHDSTLSSHDTRITKAQSDVGGVYNTVVAHDTRITTARSAAATAQARADAAHGLAVQANNAVQALRSEVHDWMQSARANDPALPPPIPR